MQKFFKVVLNLLAVVWLAGCSQAQQDENTDEAAIRNLTEAYQEAYNEQDVAKLAALWAPNAVYNNPVTGDFAEGRDAIGKLFKEKFAQNVKKHIEVAIRRIEFPNKDQAIEDGVIKVTAPDQPTHQMAYKLEIVRENGKWLVNAIHEIIQQSPSSNFEHLKDLAWLVGKWEDSDENVQILFDNQWDKYKNFLTQHFKMKIYGQDDIEGKQIIAWDPLKNVIRSWVFDSDGGFGEGTWVKENKSWYATMRYTLSDGRVASSTHIYTPVDDHSYTFASVEREVDGEILPNMNPVTVQKIE